MSGRPTSSWRPSVSATLLPRLGVPAQWVPDPRACRRRGHGGPARGPARTAPSSGCSRGWVVELVPPVGSPVGLTPARHDGCRARGRTAAGRAHLVAAHPLPRTRGAVRRPPRSSTRFVGGGARLASAVLAEGSVDVGPATPGGSSLPRSSLGAPAAAPGSSLLYWSLVRRRSARRSARRGGVRAAGRAPSGAALGVHGIVLCLLGTLFGRLTGCRSASATTTCAPPRRSTPGRSCSPVRGRILDAGGKPSVTTLCRHRDDRARHAARRDDEGRDLVTRVATVLGLPPEQLWGRTRPCGTSGAPRAPACFNGSPYQPIPVATGVDERRALSLLEQPGRYPGVAVIAEPVRHYPHPGGVNASQLLGYLGRATGEEVTHVGRAHRGHRPGRPGRAGGPVRRRAARRERADDPVGRPPWRGHRPAVGHRPGHRRRRRHAPVRTDPGGQRARPGRRGRRGAAARASGPTPAPPSSWTSPTGRSSRRPATRRTSRRSGPAGSASATSTRSPTRRRARRWSTGRRRRCSRPPRRSRWSRCPRRSRRATA